MNNILIKSQYDVNVIPTIIAQGERKPDMLIGSKVKELMDKQNISEDDLIEEIGNSYRSNIERILKDTEIPSPKMIEKLIKIFNVEVDYFTDKEVQNVIIVQGGMIVGKYETNKRALEVLEELKKEQEEAFVNNKPVIYVMPEK